MKVGMIFLKAAPAARRLRQARKPFGTPHSMRYLIGVSAGACWCLTPAPRGDATGAGAPLYSRCTPYRSQISGSAQQPSYFNLDFI